MKRQFAFIPALILSILLQGCYSQGSSAPAPTNVNVIAGDSSATITWDMLPGVEYWIFKAAANDITPSTCFGAPQCQIIMKAVSPTVASGLTNSTTYSFTINGRIDGGKGGPGSPSVQAIPRLAGAIWSVGTPSGTSDLHGVAHGTVFVAAGASGALFSSTDGATWTALTNPLPAVNLNAVAYAGGKYLVVGAGGTILLSTDGITWTQQTSGTTNDLLAVTSNGASGFIAAGANGAIIYSGDGVTWNTGNSNTTNALYGITYGYGKFVAVGAAGTLITSTDGVTWGVANASLSASLSSTNLRAVSYGLVTGSTTGTFVVLGDNGTLVSNTDSVNWNLQTYAISTATVNSVTFGHQFVAVDNIGGIYVSVDGLSWTIASSTPVNTSPLYAVASGPYDYSAVGAAGVNMHAM